MKFLALGNLSQVVEILLATIVTVEFHVAFLFFVAIRFMNQAPCSHVSDYIETKNCIYDKV